MDDRFDELAKLLEEYTNRLQKLYRDYNEHRKMNHRKKMVVLAAFSIVVLGVIFFSFLWQPEISSSNTEDLYLTALVTISGGLALIYFFLLNTPDFDRREVIDEMTLLNNQLSDIVMRASQTFEHNKETDLQNYRIRLKIIEAEDILKKTNKIIE